MRRIWSLCCCLGLLATVVGCGAYRYTAGVCDCAPPPIEALLQPVQLPPHLCPQAQPMAAPPAKMPAVGG
jgi:hypothetical protein